MDYEFNYLNDLFFGLPSTQTSSQGESSTMTTTTNGDLNSSQFVNSLLVEEEPKPNGGIFYPFPQQPKMDLSCSQEGLGSNGQLGSDKDDEEPEIIEDDDTKDVEEEEEDGLSSSPPTIYLDGSCGQQSNQDLPTQMASLEVTTSGGPRKKRKHEDEVPFSLHTEQDPQRLVSDQAVPNDLFATEIPVSSATFAFAASNSSIPPVTKTEPLTSFVPPSSSQSSSSASSSTSQSFPPRLSAVHSTAQQQLNQVHAMQIQQKEQLLKLHEVQKKVLFQPEMQTFKMVDTEQRQMKMKIEEELAFLHTIFSTHILDPPDLHKHAFLKQDLELQLKQVELYHRELQMLVQPPAPRCIAALVIVKQPFPLIITKGKQLAEEDLEVRLLTGAAMSIKSCGPVKASLIFDCHQAKGVVEKMLASDEQPLDITKQTAKMPLKFLQGSRKTSVTLKFSMQLKAGQGDSATTATVESDSSRHFVVITNEIQWQGSAGTLLKRDAFDGQLEITWPQFANALQRHVLKATKQDPVRPARCLSGYDLRYIKAKFFADRDVLTQKDFESFWNWFGKNLQMLRYQRHICNLWQQGLIYGFLTRVDVNDALTGQEPGTFLLRFSERHPGQFGVAYVGMEPPHKIKHYLIQKSDTAGAKKTLPDFLGDCPQFRFLLQLSANPSTGEAVFRKLQKDQCLKPFYSKRAPPPTGSGYDPL